MSVLNLKVSQVTHVAEKQNVEPVIDQVITMEPELRLCIFVECCSLLINTQNLWLFW